jgi:DNA-binding response OmpR family regulator
MERPGVVLSKADLEGRLYGWQEEVESNTVEVHVHKLRSKIGHSKIETMRGIGYRMRQTPS